MSHTFRKYEADGPCYRNGYARNPTESAAPGLWNGLRCAWIPQFGHTGQVSRNVARPYANYYGDAPDYDGLIIAGNPWKYDPEVGPCLDLTSSYIIGPYNRKPEYVNFDDSFAIACRFKLPSSGSTLGIFQVGNTLADGTPMVLCQMENTTTVRFYFAGGYRESYTVTNDDWHMAVALYDGPGDKWRSCVDGQVSSPVTLTTVTNASSTDELWVGGGYNGYGNITAAETYYWDRTLTSAEAVAICNDGLLPFRFKKRPAQVKSGTAGGGIGSIFSSTIFGGQVIA